MGGSTPTAAALDTIEKRIIEETKIQKYKEIVLFVISDGTYRFYGKYSCYKF
jgi:hypothetical protein